MGMDVHGCWSVVALGESSVLVVQIRREQGYEAYFQGSPAEPYVYEEVRICVDGSEASRIGVWPWTKEKR